MNGKTEISKGVSSVNSKESEVRLMLAGSMLLLMLMMLPLRESILLHHTSQDPSTQKDP